MTYGTDYADASNRDIHAELCRRLKAARLNADLTQAELAGKSGLSLRTVIRAESGESGTTLLTLIALLRALGRLRTLDAILPEPQRSPLMVRESSDRDRKRASRRRPRPEQEAGGSWKWGDEE